MGWLKSFIKAPKLGKRIFGQHSALGQTIDSTATKARKEAVPIIFSAAIGTAVTATTQNPALGTAAAMGFKHRFFK